LYLLGLLTMSLAFSIAIARSVLALI